MIKYLFGIMKASTTLAILNDTLFFPGHLMEILAINVESMLLHVGYLRRWYSCWYCSYTKTTSVWQTYMKDSSFKLRNI